MKITKGKAEIKILKYYEEPKEIIAGVGVVESIKGGTYWTMICDMLFPKTDEEYIKEHDQIKANAELIKEAFNVANETGFSPRQLAEQKAELVKQLKELVMYIDADNDLKVEMYPQVIDNAKELLKQAN